MNRVDPPVWTGRDDGPGAEHRRWHGTVRPLDGADRAGTVIVGFASDEGVRRNGGRTGAAEGPTALRRALAPLALHRDEALYDAGDVRVDDGDLETGQRALGAVVAGAMRAGHLPVVLGGGHEVAYASYLGLDEGLGSDRTRTLGVLNIDAHFDLREEPRPTSGTPFLQISEAERARGRAFRYAVVGINEAANTPVLFDRADRLGVGYLTDDQCTATHLERVLAFVRSFLDTVDDVHLTLDLDALPAWVAPGVSAPAPLGVPTEVVQAVVEEVAASGRLALFDVAELNPSLDVDGRTARVAARMVDRVRAARGRNS
ncbi:formimidoylglutamase [Nocardiopsis eucommiae]|uniref:Formimidoylglutamase n=1 Tax=Nocardiopsis eucommiae TaxID=2831970 RepID=A0A975L948_9ACTN|nr:formimidoylglutamase [Nocardiopsis eucommiae]